MDGVYFTKSGFKSNAVGGKGSLQSGASSGEYDGIVSTGKGDDKDYDEF
jgi:hypothetical protein|eukprot:COSAG01_NODE_3325_length_6252_cov_17.673980_5_plen_49_part_00